MQIVQYGGDPGFTSSQNSALVRLLAKPLTHPDIEVLGEIWKKVANPGETDELTGLDVAERLFNNHRRRFWRAVRVEPRALSLFQACGCSFPTNLEGAPVIKLPPGHKTLQGKDEWRLDIDHIEEKQNQFKLALDPTNLRIVTSRENQVVLRLLHHYNRVRLR
jgi:hypothetical protein